MSMPDSAVSADPSAPPEPFSASGVLPKEQPGSAVPGKSMRLLDHLSELRRRMIRAALAVVVSRTDRAAKASELRDEIVSGETMQTPVQHAPVEIPEN